MKGFAFVAVIALFSVGFAIWAAETRRDCCPCTVSAR